MTGQRKVQIGIMLISAFCVFTGLYFIVDLFLPPTEALHPISIQLALIRVRAWGFSHIAIDLLTPLISVAGGVLFWLKRKAGWWLVVFLSSFLCILYFLAIVKGRYVGALFEGYFLLPTSIDVELLCRAFLYAAVFVFAIKRRVMGLYQLENLNHKRTISLLLLGNVIFAVLGYRLWE